MCGIALYVGIPEPDKLAKIIWEISLRGLHHVGSRDYGRVGLIHCRYSTSGLTNQPLTVGGRTLIFNGVIDMRSPALIESEEGILMETDNDGELFLRRSLTDEDVKDFLSNKASFAGAWIEKGILYVARNASRPLWRADAPGCIYFASTRRALTSAGLNPVGVEPLKIYKWTI